MGGGNFKIQNSTICIIEVKKKQKKKKQKKKQKKKHTFYFSPQSTAFFSGRKSGKFLQEILHFLQEIPVFLPEISEQLAVFP